MSEIIIKKLDIKIPSPVKLFEVFKDDMNSIFLDSNCDNPELCEYSIIAADPFLSVVSKGTDTSIITRSGPSSAKGNAFCVVNDLLNKYRVTFSEKNKYPLGAAMGYVSYDAGFLLEDIKISSKDDISWPDMRLCFYDCQIVYSHKEDSYYIVSTGFPELEPEKRAARAKERMGYFIDRIVVGIKSGFEEDGLIPKARIHSNFSKKAYIEAIGKIKQYIRLGDVYQVNLSQRFSANADSNSFCLYKAIRSVNKVPFGCYFKTEHGDVLSFSPERFLRIDGYDVATRPIKGTRPRGRTAAEDSANEAELFNSQKDKAELTMIVDLERNDLGRTCRTGSVKVKEMFKVEKYSTVMHLVAAIEGHLNKDVSHLECFASCFPGGSITGAPKIRCMEIIDEIEGIRRGIYTGAIGYFGFNRVSDFNIAIRTLVARGNSVIFSSGGGIVIDSDPEFEYEETLHKVRSFLDVLNATETAAAYI